MPRRYDSDDESYYRRIENSTDGRRKHRSHMKREIDSSNDYHAVDERRKLSKHKGARYKVQNHRDSMSDVEDSHSRQRHRSKFKKVQESHDSDSEPNLERYERKRHSKRKKKRLHSKVKEEPVSPVASRWENEAEYDSNQMKQELSSSPELERRSRKSPERTREQKMRIKNEENNSSSPKEEESKEAEAKKEKVNFELSGKLTEDANTYKGVVIKYSQPQEARKPKRRWRWYIFKGDQEIPFLPLHRKSAYLIGRERKVADIPTDHPSCSKQHAVLQYRIVSYERNDGSTGRTVKPYIIDLESANGTYLNNRKIDAKRFVELREKDVVKFGYSSREYVLLHEGSKGEDDDDGIRENELSPVSLLRS